MTRCECCWKETREIYEYGGTSMCKECYERTVPSMEDIRKTVLEGNEDVWRGTYMLDDGRRLKSWHFAFDSLDYREEVEAGIGMLYDAGINLRSCANWYVYMHDDRDWESAKTRCEILKSHKCLPYIMVNRDSERTQRMTDLKRWTRPQIFFQTSFEDYHGHK